MSGDTNNANVWADADVYVSEDLDAAFPVNAATPMGVAWQQVGLLDGSAGFPVTRAWQENDLYAWGGILVATARKNYKETWGFTSLEDNATTHALSNPGSSATAIMVPRPIRLKVCFEKRRGGRTYRRMCRNYAEIQQQNFTINEDTLEPKPYIATIYPDSDGYLWDLQGVPDLDSLAITPLTLALDVSDDTIRKLVATATYTDASTADVTDIVQWSSSAPSKATVHLGYVHPIAAGSSNISCSYAGVDADAPCVATVSA